MLDRLLDNVRGGESAALVSGVRRVSARRRCCATALGRRLAFGSFRSRGSSRRWSCRSPGCISSAGRCLTGWRVFRNRSSTLCGSRSASRPASPPDRFLVALAALSLLAEVAEGRPLLCFVDDAQWLDDASGQVLGFVARRLLAESVSIVFAVRDPTDERELAGLPELALGGLAEEDARALLATVVAGRLDDQVRDRIVAETRGNPLALLELPRGMTRRGAGGRLRAPRARRSSRADRGRTISAASSLLPEATQRLMLLAAADPAGDATLLWRAAQTLGIDGRRRHRRRRRAVAGDRRTGAVPASAREIGGVSGGSRQLIAEAVHLALAAATDPAGRSRPSRLASRARGGRARRGSRRRTRAVSRPGAGPRRAGGGGRVPGAGGRADAPTRRGARTGRWRPPKPTCTPARSMRRSELLAAAEAGALDELQRARVDLLRGQIAFASSAGSDAPAAAAEGRQAPRAARPRRSPARPISTRWGAALSPAVWPARADCSRSPGRRSAPPSAADARPTCCWTGLAALITEGRAAAAPTLRRAVTPSAAKSLRRGVAPVGLCWPRAPQSSCGTSKLGRGDTRQLELARDCRCARPVAVALNGQRRSLPRGVASFARGSCADRRRRRGQRGDRHPIAPYGALLLAALPGTAEARALIEATIKDADRQGRGTRRPVAQWTSAVLYNGLGRYEEALAAARRRAASTQELFISAWALPELVEAAVRNEKPPAGRRTRCERLRDATAAGADWGSGIEARSRALLSEGEWPRAATARRSTGSAVPGSCRARPSPSALRRMAASREPAGRRARPAATPPTTVRRMGAEGSPTGPDTSCSPPARRCASAETTPPMNSRLRRSTSHGWPATDAPTGDRRGAVHQRPHRRMAPAQGVHQARDHLTQGPRRRIAEPRPSGRASGPATRIGHPRPRHVRHPPGGRVDEMTGCRSARVGSARARSRCSAPLLPAHAASCRSAGRIGTAGLAARLVTSAIAFERCPARRRQTQWPTQRSGC